MDRALNLFDLAARDGALTPAERKQLENAARSAGQKRKGHAWTPGSGPEGQTCGGCKHYTPIASRSKKTFRKCGLMRSHWTRGPGSDIRAKDPACRHWEQAE